MSSTELQPGVKNELSGFRAQQHNKIMCYISHREESYTDHVHHFWVDGLCDDIPVVGNVLHHLAQRSPLHFLPFQIT